LVITETSGLDSVAAAAVMALNGFGEISVVVGKGVTAMGTGNLANGNCIKATRLTKLSESEVKDCKCMSCDEDVYCTLAKV
jgi:hypothetical protein